MNSYSMKWNLLVMVAFGVMAAWAAMAIEYPSMASSAHVIRYDRNGRKVGETKTMPLVVLQGLLRDLDKFSFHKKPYSYISINDLNANPLMETLSQTIAH